MADIYRQLQKFLNQFPLGFPKTDSGVEIEILKNLFTEEEAQIVILLTPFPEEAAQIAGRTDRDETELKAMLESMSKKGLVFRTRRDDKTLFNTAPFMIGLYEYSVKRIDENLAKLFKEYYDEAYMDEMGSSNVPGFKVLPITEKISTDMTLFPFFKIEEGIRAARKIAVADCVCRKEDHLTGGKCDHPMETCLSFGAAAEYYIENDMGREITAEEAIRIVEEADKSGLVHAGVNTKHLSNLCNCCPCCCASMKGIVKGHDKRKYLNALFEAVIDEEECTGCGDCVERCPVEVIALEDTATVNREKCLGCGLCATACESEAIGMHLREDREEPFDRVMNLGFAIIEGKKKAGIIP